jgi:tetratricopeptide (TPR) repeat protein
MPKDAPGRNDPCPCGSGKKYKKCCQGKEPAGGSSTAERPAWDRLPTAERDRIAKEVRRLDDLSNAAVDAIEVKRFDEAEKLCESLLREYPDMIDGHDRLAMLREAQGRFQEAADQYAKVLAMVETDPIGCAPELVAEFRQRREEALARAKSQT